MKTEPDQPECWIQNGRPSDPAGVGNDLRGIERRGHEHQRWPVVGLTHASRRAIRYNPDLRDGWKIRFEEIGRSYEDESLSSFEEGQDLEIEEEESQSTRMRGYVRSRINRFPTYEEGTDDDTRSQRYIHITWTEAGGCLSNRRSDSDRRTLNSKLERGNTRTRSSTKLEVRTRRDPAQALSKQSATARPWDCATTPRPPTDVTTADCELRTAHGKSEPQENEKLKK
ncbi:hypothetical protein KEM48_013467 [Puccinia striiformis f. sp. tritici PST-130]|nr:hypothetical protein KEM48_013467 [Puccinia striiformis f. sp. tritici PST-130]